MRCRLEFAHDCEHMAHKDGITWTREDSDQIPPSLDFGIDTILGRDLPAGVESGPVTKGYSQ